MQEWFRKLAQTTSMLVGGAHAFATALALIIIWAILGPFLGFSDTWQLVINTATTVLTFLIVFLIQNAQNRHAAEIQLKLDEIIRALKPARTRLVSLDDLSDSDLEELKKQFDMMAKESPALGKRSAAKAVRRRRPRRQEASRSS